MPHVDEGTLHALLDGALRAEEPERAHEVEAHLETCADCRARLEQAASLRDRAAGILGSLEPAPAGGDFQEVLARAARSAGAEGGAETLGGESTSDDATGDRSVAELRRRYGGTRGLAWAATIVVALGAGYMARDLVGPLGQDSARLMVRSPAPASEATEDAAPTRRQQPSAAGAAEREAASEPPSTQSIVNEQASPGARAAPTEAAAGAAAEAEAETAPSETAPPMAEAMEDRAPARAMEAEALGVEAAAGADVAELDAAAAHLTGADAGAALKAGDIDWEPAELAEAEARVGPILVLPDAEVAEVALAASGEPVARTLQRLPGGVEVRVVQMPGQTLEASGLPAGAISPAEPGAPAAERRQVAELAAPVVAELEGVTDSVAAPDSTMVFRTVHLVRDDVLLTLSAPLAPEALRALAAEAAPRSRQDR